MHDPNGLDYPADQELRSLLAKEIWKLQSSTPERLKTAEAAEHWAEYTASVVQRLEEAENASQGRGPDDRHA